MFKYICLLFESWELNMVWNFSSTRQSKREYEDDQKKRKTQEEAAMKKEMESLIQISQVEHSRLEEEKTKEKAKLDQVRIWLSLNKFKFIL